MLHGTCCTGHAARDMLHGTCCTGHAARDMLHGTCCPQQLAHHIIVDCAGICLCVPHPRLVHTSLVLHHISVCIHRTTPSHHSDIMFLLAVQAQAPVVMPATQQCGQWNSTMCPLHSSAVSGIVPCAAGRQLQRGVRYLQRSLTRSPLVFGRGLPGCRGCRSGSSAR
jgi:hypothetical protein